MSEKKQTHRLEGVIEEALPSTTFRVKLDNGKEILAHLAGKLRINRIKVLPGDNVVVELASLDDDRGRIVYRRK
ncbi:translation initiation factor IF-1 [Patescibacteria group bacterium]|nr:translation initiation factor IF-1 [Patescibacteria group bacterium]MBU4162438.1 translation initiation factor IF-1 [Patescibacteria group bacterium]